MIRNYLLTAFRNIVRYKMFTFLNVLGLAAGLVSCLFIYLYVSDELSFDKSFEKADRIYRIQSFYKFGDVEDKFGISAFPVVPTLVRDFPEIEDGTRLTVLNGQNFKRDESIYEVENVFFADSNFFSVFDFEFISGDGATALMEPRSLVLTETEASRIFGREHPVGKMLDWNSQLLKVTGIIRDREFNTHIPLGAFISMATASPAFTENASDNWGNNNSYAYIVLQREGMAKEIQPRLDELVSKYILPQWQTLGFKGSIEMFAEPLKDIHFNNYLIYDTPKKGNLNYVYIFSAVAILILTLACMNFVNLSMAAATRRTKEVAVRKVSGAGRGQLIRQFLGEALIIALLSALVSLVMLELLLPLFNNIAGKNFTTGEAFDLQLILVLFGLVIFVAVLAGSYPAFYLSGLSPKAIFSSAGGTKSGGVLLKKALVTCQFVLSLGMIVATITVFSQVKHLRNADTGFVKENRVVISLPPGDSLQSVRLRTLRAELNGLSVVEHAVRSAHIPGEDPARLVYQVKRAGGNEDKPVATMFTETGFLKMMHMQLAAGDYFPAGTESAPPQNVVMINEAAARAFGLEDPLNEKLYFPGDGENPDTELRIVGVLRDFNFSSLHQPVEPLAVLPQHPLGNAGSLVVSLKPGSLQDAIHAISEKWKQVFPTKPFEYILLDDKLGALYTAEDKMFRVFIYFASIALLLSCLGLYGLSAFTARQRTKEIGVRKVLGASVFQILVLVNRDFTMLFLVACALSFPIAWWAMTGWLEQFAYHTSMQFFFFFIPAIFVLTLTLLTVSYHIIRTSMANPVKSLRYE